MGAVKDGVLFCQAYLFYMLGSSLCRFSDFGFRENSLVGKNVSHNLYILKLPAALKTMTYEIAILYISILFAFTALRAQFVLSIICLNLFLISHRMRQIGE